MMLGDELRTTVALLYEQSRAQAAAEDPPEILPPWDDLPLAMRIAVLHVFSVGRQLGADEERKRINRMATDQG
jgi:hypothetical protein